MDPETLPREWDVVVVGAGVAGAVSAWRLARRGLRVLLSDRSGWPRDKACGGCINPAALRSLASAGLQGICRIGSPYSRMRLGSGRHEAVLPLPAGRAVSRRCLDAALTERAVAAGARFLPATRATLGEPLAHGRRVLLRSGSRRAAVTARLVLACDGLGSRLLEEAPSGLHIDAASPIGLGTVIDDAPSFYRRGMVHMACGRHGYLGLVRAEDDRLNVGAAVDPDWMKRLGGAAPAARAILRSAGFPVFGSLMEARWLGTPRLTRRRCRLGGERVLALGDAAGYVEPFTGEGMAWALAGAEAVEPLALAAVEYWRDDLPERWTARHTSLIRSRQRGCRAVSAALRRPRLVASMLPLVGAVPAAVGPFTAWLSRDYGSRGGARTGEGG